MSTENQKPRIVDASGNATAAAAVGADAGLSSEALSALGYLCGIIAVVALCLDPYKRQAKVRFHAVQALLFQASWVVAYLALTLVLAIIGGIFSVIFSALKLYSVSALVLGLFPLVTGLFSLAMLATWVYLIVAAATGKNPRLPILSAFASKFAQS